MDRAKTELNEFEFPKSIPKFNSLKSFPYHTNSSNKTPSEKTKTKSRNFSENENLKVKNVHPHSMNNTENYSSPKKHFYFY